MLSPLNPDLWCCLSQYKFSSSKKLKLYTHIYNYALKKASKKSLHCSIWLSLSSEVGAETHPVKSHLSYNFLSHLLYFSLVSCPQNHGEWPCSVLQHCSPSLDRHQPIWHHKNCALWVSRQTDSRNILEFIDHKMRHMTRSSSAKACAKPGLVALLFFNISQYLCTNVLYWRTCSLNLPIFFFGTVTCSASFILSGLNQLFNLPWPQVWHSLSIWNVFTDWNNQDFYILPYIS